LKSPCNVSISQSPDWHVVINFNAKNWVAPFFSIALLCYFRVTAGVH
jgi:hypothetical protein